MFKFIRNMFKRNDNKIDVKKIKSNMVFIDLGASSIKACDNKGRLINFRSSVREIINPGEITIQKNIIRVGDKCYAVGENKVSPSMEILKHKKKHYEVLILYALMLLGVKGENVSVNLLLPFNQLVHKVEFEKVLNKRWGIKDNRNNTLEYNIKVRECYSEGEMSIYHINTLYKNIGKNIVVINIGYSTIDIIVVNKDGSREKILSLPLAMRELLPIHASILGVRTGALLSAWISDGYVYPLQVRKAIKQANFEYIEEFMSEIYLTILTLVNPQNTVCFIAGGGCNSIGQDLNDWIKNQELIKDFSVKVLEGDNALYTDLLGMFNYVNSTPIINEEIEITPIIESVKEDIIEVTPVEDVKEEIIPKQITLLEEVTPVKKNNTNRLDYKVLIPKVLEIYKNKPTLTELQNKFNISKQQARTLISKCY